jgi:hypothetical protein
MEVKYLIHRLPQVILLAVLCLTSPVVISAPVTMCVFDLLGANGPVYAQMKDYKIAALDWGVKLILKPYTNERVATDDFKTGRCHAVSFTGTQSRQFNHFTSSLDAMGAVPSYAHLKTVITTISAEKAAPLMINSPYEIAGIIPLGAAYLFVNDRKLVASGDLAGIRVAIMDSDPAQSEMVDFVGSSPVGTSISSMYSNFNNGAVDGVYGPAVVYEAMELYKGMRSSGGVVRFPVAQLTLQIVIRSAEFPTGYGQKSRSYTLSQFDKAVRLAQYNESRIASKWWITIPERDQQRYHEMYRLTRISLSEKGVYNKQMLTVLRKVRCKKDPEKAECTAVDRE